MVLLSDIDFGKLQVGMKFHHIDEGEQIIIDLDRGQFGPIIRFHNSNTYSGEMPKFGEEEGEIDIFQALACRIFPYGAEHWEYLGMASEDEIEKHGWLWWQVPCPHCGFIHRLLLSEPKQSIRICRQCGMTFDHPCNTN
jgi:hypothetical protein